MRESFATTAKQAFALLEHKGFRLFQNESGDLQYDSDRSFMVVSWDPGSGELDASVGLTPRTGQAKDEYSIADVMRLDGVPESDCRPPQVADEARLGPFLEKLAVAVRMHAQPALAGDRAYFQRLEAFRTAKAKIDPRNMQMRQVRAAAREAWDRQDLDRVASLLESVKDELTDSEARKLDYARQHRHDSTRLQGSVEISDPWDFPQIGRIPVVVLATGPDETLVQFETPVAYRGRTYGAARLNPRHEGGELARAADAPLHVNITLLHDPTAGPRDTDVSQQVYVAGTFRPNDAATSPQPPQAS